MVYSPMYAGEMGALRRRRTMDAAAEDAYGENLQARPAEDSGLAPGYGAEGAYYENKLERSLSPGGLGVRRNTARVTSSRLLEPARDIWGGAGTGTGEGQRTKDKGQIEGQIAGADGGVRAPRGALNVARGTGAGTVDKAAAAADKARGTAFKAGVQDITSYWDDQERRAKDEIGDVVSANRTLRGGMLRQGYTPASTDAALNTGDTSGLELAPAKVKPADPDLELKRRKMWEGLSNNRAPRRTDKKYVDAGIKGDELFSQDQAAHDARWLDYQAKHPLPEPGATAGTAGAAGGAQGGAGGAGIQARLDQTARQFGQVNVNGPALNQVRADQQAAVNPEGWTPPSTAEAAGKVAVPSGPGAYEQSAAAFGALPMREKLARVSAMRPPALETARAMGISPSLAPPRLSPARRALEPPGSNESSLLASNAGDVIRDWEQPNYLNPAKREIFGDEVYRVLDSIPASSVSNPIQRLKPLPEVPYETPTERAAGALAPARKHAYNWVDTLPEPIKPPQQWEGYPEMDEDQEMAHWAESNMDSADPDKRQRALEALRMLGYTFSG